MIVSPPLKVDLAGVTVKGDMPVCATLGEWFGIIALHWPAGAPLE